jgi:hypothetical protein
MIAFLAALAAVQLLALAIAWALGALRWTL